MPVPAHATPRLAVAALMAILLGLIAAPARADQTFASRGTASAGVGMPQYGAEGYAVAGAATSRSWRSTTRARRSGQTPRTPGSACSCRADRRASRSRARPASSTRREERRHGRRRRLGHRQLERRRLRRRERRRHAARLGLGRSRAVHPGRREPRPARRHGALRRRDRTYRGSLRVIEGASGLDAVNVLALEDYLRGVVPSEVPSSWRPAALEAQAIAARGTPSRPPSRSARSSTSTPTRARRPTPACRPRPRRRMPRSRRRAGWC